jgi:murein DD-endopeptidase MepM/ murein hydrolase activator NlpD
VNPLPGFSKGRTDQGVDYSAQPGAPIRAIGDAKVLGILPDWYKGQPFVYYELLSGPAKGKVVYVAEQISPHVKPGQRVRAGQAIGTYATSGTGIETGFAQRNGQVETPYGSRPDGTETQGGLRAKHFLKQLGAR